MLPFSCKPSLIVSPCLALRSCRYDGSINEYPQGLQLYSHCEIHPLCPEEDAGFPTPRPPMQMVESPQGKIQLLRLGDKQDYAPILERFSQNLIPSLPNLDGAILKAKSPSCGLESCKLHQEGFNGPVIDRKDGLFAAELKKQRPEIAIFSDQDFLSPIPREKSLLHLFLGAAFRQLFLRAASRQEANWKDFHLQNEWLWQAYGTELSHKLDRAYQENQAQNYQVILMEALKIGPTKEGWKTAYERYHKITHGN